MSDGRYGAWPVILGVRWFTCPSPWLPSGRSSPDNLTRWSVHSVMSRLPYDPNIDTLSLGRSEPAISHDREILSGREGGQIPIPVCQLPPQAHQSHPLHHQCWGDGFSDNETIMVRLSFTGLLQLPRVMGLLSKPTPISPSFRPPPTLSSLNTKNKGQSSHFIGLQRSLLQK